MSEAGLSPERLARLDVSLRRSVEAGRIAGFQALLARRGKLVHESRAGFLDLAARRPMRGDAIFRVFSMTKPVTSVAALMLIEEGRFHLDTPVGEFIPEFGRLQVLSGTEGGEDRLEPLARQVTIHDLLTHCSGLGYGLAAFDPLERRYLEACLLRTGETLAEKMPRIASLPLHHQPGLRYTYSIGTDVLARVVELVSGMELDRFFSTRIFEPLGMVDTGFFVTPQKLDRLSSLYTLGPDGSLADVGSLDPSGAGHFMQGAWVDKSVKPRFLSGGGGLVSSAADYLRFALMLRNGGELDAERLLGRKTVELMTAPCLRPEQFPLPGCSYGLGLTVLVNPAHAHLLGSTGAFGGSGAANTDFWVDPKEDLVGVLMVQFAATTPITVARDFRVGAAQALVS